MGVWARVGSCAIAISALFGASIAAADAPEEDGARQALNALAMHIGDAGPPPALALSRAREMLEKRDAWATARRASEAQLAETTARLWMTVAEHSWKLSEERARAAHLDGGAARANRLIEKEAREVGLLEDKLQKLLLTIGDREERLSRSSRDAGARR